MPVYIPETRNMPSTICLSMQNGKIGEGQRSDKINQMFVKSLSGDLHVSPNRFTKFQGPISNSFQDIVLTIFHCLIGNKSKKGHNSGAKSQMKTKQKKTNKKTKKKTVQLFSIPIPDIKFQDPISNRSSSMLGSCGNGTQAIIQIHKSVNE